MGNPVLAGPAGPPFTHFPTDPGIEPSEIPRLTRQNLVMLAALHRGPVWNYNLANIGRSYTRRISDIRAAGVRVEIVATGKHGARLYAIVDTCPICDGRGFGAIRYERLGKAPWVKADWPDCPTCNGKGWLRRTYDTDFPAAPATDGVGPC